MFDLLPAINLVIKNYNDLNMTYSYPILSKSCCVNKKYIYFKLLFWMIN